MENIREPNELPSDTTTTSKRILEFGPTASAIESGRPTAESERHGFCHFVAELRRRRVFRTATLYAVTMWLVCQVIELVYPVLGLPDWTLTLVIVLGIIGFPIALILSWFIDITPDGLEVDSAHSNWRSVAKVVGERSIFGKVVDSCLLIAALGVCLQLATGVLSAKTVASESSAPTVAVESFRVASGVDAGLLSDGLLIELQHELVTQTELTVIASSGSYLQSDTMRLTGCLSIGESEVRVTAIMINNDTGAITWSHVFQRPRSDSLQIPVDFAKDIVAALPISLRLANISGEQS
jgi:TolB-like protein